MTMVVASVPSAGDYTIVVRPPWGGGEDVLFNKYF